jgi:hypothetical protein
MDKALLHFFCFLPFEPKTGENPPEHRNSRQRNRPFEEAKKDFSICSKMTMETDVDTAVEALLGMSSPRHKSLKRGSDLGAGPSRQRMQRRKSDSSASTSTLLTEPVFSSETTPMEPIYPVQPRTVQIYKPPKTHVNQ